MYLPSNDVREIIFPHIWYLSNFTCILESISLSFAIEIDAMHWKKVPIYDVYCIGRHQYQRCLNILFLRGVSVAQLVASLSGVVLGGVVEVVGSNLARGKIFTASISYWFIISLCVCIYIKWLQKKRFNISNGPFLAGWWMSLVFHGLIVVYIIQLFHACLYEICFMFIWTDLDFTFCGCI